MKNLKNVLAAAVLAGTLSAGTVAVPAQAAGKEKSGGAGSTATYVNEQTSSATADVKQNSGMKVRPGETEHYSGTNVSYVGQSAEADTTTVTKSDGDLEVENTTKQKISNSARIKQGTYKVLPHSVLYYDATNISYVDQYAENTNTTVTKSQGKLKLKNTVQQEAHNTADVEQGTVKALPHSTVYYEGVNESYITQHAENTNTTVTESGGTAEVQESVEQDTSNVADVEQGVIEQFRHSTVHDDGYNVSVVEQYESSTAN
jgi:hypothetical protein